MCIRDRARVSGLRARLGFQPFFLNGYTRGVGFATEDKDMNVTLADGRLRFWSDASGYSNYGRWIDPEDDNIPILLSVPDPIENPAQPALPAPLGVPVVTPGSDDSHENEWLNSLTF